jgi:hypothetical protein
MACGMIVDPSTDRECGKTSRWELDSDPEHTICDECWCSLDDDIGAEYTGIEPGSDREHEVRAKAIRKRLEWPQCSASDVALLEAVIARAYEVCHETGNPDTFDQFVEDTVRSFVVDVARVASIAREPSSSGR